MLYNIAAPILNPCPAPFSNARFPAPKVPFRKTSPSAQTPIFKARKAFCNLRQEQPPNPHMYTLTQKRVHPKTQNRKNPGPAEWPPRLESRNAYFCSVSRVHFRFRGCESKRKMALWWSRTAETKPQTRGAEGFLKKCLECKSAKK